MIRACEAPERRGISFAAALVCDELAESGEVQRVVGWFETGLVEEEGRDQMRVAADDAEPAAELLLRLGHSAGTPPSDAGASGRNRAES